MDEAFRAAVAANVKLALAEDLGSGDLTAQLIAPEAKAKAEVVTREPGLFCGQPWVEETCRQADPSIALRWQVADGDQIAAGQALLELQGRARSLLSAERTLLNFAQLLSGTATRTRRWAALVKGSRAQLLDTRKTIPGLRLAQKYAVRCGGGGNHRMGLFDAYLIKENHIAAAGSIAAALQRARALNPGLPVEVEAESLAQLDEALAAGAERILLDNFSVQQCAAAVARAAGRAKLEASGGIDQGSLAAFAQTGVDYISAGALTKNVQPLDFSMRFVQQ